MSYTPTVATMQALRPSQVTGLRATVTKNTVALSWGQTATTKRPITGNYIIVDGVVVATTTAPIVSYSATIAAAGSHTVDVKTYNSVGQSAAKRIKVTVLPTLAAGVLPGQPTGPSASPSGAKFILTWTNGANTQQVKILRDGVPVFTGGYPSAVPTTFTSQKIRNGSHVFTIQGVNYNGSGTVATVNVNASSYTAGTPVAGSIVALGQGADGSVLMSSATGAAPWTEQPTPFDGGFAVPRGLGVGTDQAGNILYLITGSETPLPQPAPFGILYPTSLLQVIGSNDTVNWAGPNTLDPAAIACPTTNPVWTGAEWVVGGIAQLVTYGGTPQTVVFTSADPFGISSPTAWAVTSIPGAEIIPSKLAYANGQMVMVGASIQLVGGLGNFQLISQSVIVLPAGSSPLVGSEWVIQTTPMDGVDAAIDVAYGAGEWVVAYVSCETISSADANNDWVGAESGASGTVWPLLTANGGINSLAFTNSTFFVCGVAGSPSGGCILESTDGVNWVELVASAAAALNYQGLSGGVWNGTDYFFGTGEGQVILTTSDLVHFSSPVTPWDTGGVVTQLIDLA